MKRESERMKVLQFNLHHGRTASAALTVAMKNCNVALIKEPSTYKGEIKRLKEVGGEPIFSRSTPYLYFSKERLPDTAVDVSLF